MAFFRVPLRESDRVKTTCKIGNSFYRFKVMPMGFKNSPAIFQRIMESILQRKLEEGVAQVYIDDVLVSTKECKEHLKILGTVLRKLKEHGMEINWEKVKLMRREIKFLGHTLSENRVRPLDDRITQICNIPTPTTVKQVRGFLGQVNYLGRHIYNLSELKAPLNEFSQKGKKFVWEDRHQEAFEELNIAVKKAIAAVIPDPDKEFTLETDASDTGLGAVLKQDEGVIGFYSTRLNATQQKYTITEKELLAAVWAMDRCKHYLLGKHFYLVTDHKALEALFTKRDKEFGNDRIHRWSLALENFNFTPIYRRGEDMIIPDSLSRMYGERIPSVDEDLPTVIAKIEPETRDVIIEIHRELGHRKSIVKDLKARGIEVSAKELGDILTKCRECQERDNLFIRCNTYVDTTEPGELVGLDLMEYHSQYIVVAIDYFTRKVFTRSSFSKEADKVIPFLETVHKQLPIKKIITDNGREFVNSQMTRWLDDNDVDVHYRAPYYHQGTGRVERVIQTLRKALNKTKGALRAKLSRVTRQYNRTVHRAIGMSPDQALQEENHERVRDSIRKYKREFHDSKSTQLSVGQPVLIRKDIREGKDDKHFEEQGKITGLLSPKTYQVLLDSGKECRRHRSQLKPL